MSEIVLVVIPGGDRVAVKVPPGVNVSKFRDDIEGDLHMDTLAEVDLVTVAHLRKLAKEAQAT